MARVKETINFRVKGQDIELINDGIKKLDDQKDGLANAMDYVEERMKLGEKKGWTPYANFESSITWKIIPSLPQSGDASMVEAKKFISDNGYGTGSNFTVGNVASLMVRFNNSKTK